MTELHHFHPARKGSGSLRPFPIYPLYTQAEILSLDKPIADCFLFRPRKRLEKRRKRSHTNVSSTLSTRSSTPPAQTPHVRFHRRKRVRTRLCQQDRTQRLTRRNRGRFGWGCYLYPRTVLCGSETLHGRVSERQTLPLLGLGRGESRRAQRAFGTAMRMMRVAVPRRRGPVGTCSPAAGSCAVLVSFTVCHRCVEIQERAFTRLAVPTALSARCDVQWFCPMQ